MAVPGAASGGWPAGGRRFLDSTTVIKIATKTALGNNPSSMLGWFAAPQDGSGCTDKILFCTGDGAPSTGANDENRARAFALELPSPGHAQATYYQGGDPHDMVDIIDKDRALSVAVTDAQWHHIAVVDDCKELIVYLDGEVIGKRAIVDTARNTAAGYVIGGWPDPNRYFKGFLAGVQFYSAAVTAVDVGNVMTSTKPGEAALCCCVAV